MNPIINYTMYGLQIIQVLFLFLAGFFAIEAVNVLRQKREHYEKKGNKFMIAKCRIFPFLMVGMITLTIAYTVKHVYSYIYAEVIPLVSDIFFIISYLALIIAFSVFWVDTRKHHTLQKKEPFFFFGVIILVVVWLYYLFVKILAPEVGTLPILNHYLNYFYPAAAAFLFFTTLIIYPQYKAKKIHSPLWYLSAGVFLNFLAEMMYIYSKWQLSMEFVSVVYNVLFMFSAMYFLMGFYVAFRKYKK